MFKFTAYTDGACSGNPGIGGWGAVLLAEKNNSDSVKIFVSVEVPDNVAVSLSAEIKVKGF